MYIVHGIQKSTGFWIDFNKFWISIIGFWILSFEFQIPTIVGGFRIPCITISYTSGC